MALLLEDEVANMTGAGHGIGRGHPLAPAARHWRGRAQAGEQFTGRAIHDEIHPQQGWHEAATISSGQQRWGATMPGMRIAAGLFRTRAPGLR